MAEIKSTMEMVLARAERLCATVDDPEDETLLHSGMRDGSSFLNGDSIDLTANVKRLSADDQAKYITGLLQTFLRNINLPREDNQPWEGALSGLNLAAQGWPADISASLSGLINEIRSVLSRYLGHRQQLKKQLSDNFASQAAQLEQTMMQQSGVKMNIAPEQHPKFREEWQKVVNQLNDQYLNAINQYKDAILQLFSI